MGEATFFGVSSDSVQPDLSKRLRKRLRSSSIPRGSRDNAAAI